MAKSSLEKALEKYQKEAQKISRSKSMQKRSLQINNVERLRNKQGLRQEEKEQLLL